MILDVNNKVGLFVAGVVVITRGVWCSLHLLVKRFVRGQNVKIPLAEYRGEIQVVKYLPEVFCVEIMLNFVT